MCYPLAAWAVNKATRDTILLCVRIEYSGVPQHRACTQSVGRDDLPACAGDVMRQLLNCFVMALGCISDKKPVCTGHSVEDAVPP